MSELPFRKMHGLGNDFVVLDLRETDLPLSPMHISRIADRHLGVGCDQVVTVDHGVDGSARLRFYNPDGSEAGACGNASRCIGRLLLLEMDRSEIMLETEGGRLVARRRPDGLITVMMGEPVFDWREIPLARECDIDALPIARGARLKAPSALSMGNPHAVFFVEDLAMIDIPRVGPGLERDPLFPERANIGFAQMLDPTTIRLRVFERGAGLTRACGSGACAAMVAARRRGLIGDRATMVMDGGALEIAWPGRGPVEMTGPTSFVFSGHLSEELFAD